MNPIAKITKQDQNKTYKINIYSNWSLLEASKYFTSSLLRVLSASARINTFIDSKLNSSLHPDKTCYGQFIKLNDMEMKKCGGNYRIWSNF